MAFTGKTQPVALMSLTFALVRALPLSSLKAGQAPLYLVNCQSPSLQASGTACHSIVLAASNFDVRGCHTVPACRGALQPTAHLAQPPEPLLAPCGLWWLKEPSGPALEKPLSTSRRCQPSLCSSSLAVTLPHCSSRFGAAGIP